MTTVRDGIYLEDHRPVRSQFRVGRRDPIKPVIVVHTAESGTDVEGPDPKAENVAAFIRRRSNAGSYHLVGDADSIIQLVRFENEAYGDGTGSNRWAIHISLAMDAADWPSLTAERRTALVTSAAWMARYAADWLEANGHGRPAARLLTKAESDQRNASGFISHARRDPARRTDPGDGFPWNEFFTYYEGADMPNTIEVPDRDYLAIQAVLSEAGFDPGPHDGVPGPKGLRAVTAALVELQNLRAGGWGEREAGLWRRYVAAVSESAALEDIARSEGAK